MKQKVLVTGIVSKSGLTELMSKFEVTFSEGEPFSRKWVLENLWQYDGVLLMGQKADREFIDAGKNLKVIAVNAVGFDHVDITYAKEKGIVVANAPQGVRIPTAEMTFALILATSKRLFFYDSVVRCGNWMDVSEPEFQGTTLNGKTLGVYGFGRIGQTVAKLGKAFGMKVIYNDYQKMPTDVEEETDATFVSFSDLLTKSDVISIHAPALKSTIGIFNEEAFHKMKKTSYLINAARGVIVKESDLLNALQAGEIAGAGLDVMEFEPNVSAELRSLSNVIFSPHAGTGTVEARHNIAHEAASNIIAALEGNPKNVVNL